MRRPLSIMSADPESGRVEFLYKVLGQGLLDLSQATVGEEISLLAPIGNGFTVDPARTTPLLIGGGVGIPPMVFMAVWLRARHEHHQPIMFMGSELPFPMATRPASDRDTGFPADATHTLDLAEELGIVCRCASLSGQPGAHRGYVTDLARLWIESRPAAERSSMEILACGPEAMLEAAAGLARETGLESQLCLEEYMACGVGGCAGCTVEVEVDGETAMKRVCVDGPVFPGNQVYPD